MNQGDCQIEQIASYLDDELDEAALKQFETHIKECDHCSAELIEQRRLLGTLTSALNHDSALSLPRDFARVVAAHAESDMSGVREGHEHRRALRLCLVLAVASLALLGVAAWTYVGNFARTVGRPISVVLDLGWTTIYDAVTGLIVISRVISQGVMPPYLIGLGFLLLALAVLLLSRLIVSYHRTRLIE
jgi:hypothetical protein